MMTLLPDNQTFCYWINRHWKVLVWVLFGGLSLFVGYHHEPWADEAQAWLIARDATSWEILSEFARCEGQPPMWHLLLRGLILCGFPYSCFYLIPWVISLLGVGVFLWKSPFPKWVSILVPFTYFIFFQYTIIARQYCFSLLFLSTIATLYPTRHTRPFLYAIVLCLLGFSSTPALLISGSLYFLFLCENLHLSTSKKSNWLAAGFIFVFMLTMVAVLLPDLNNPFFVRSVLKTRDPLGPTERMLIELPRITALTFFSNDSFLTPLNVFLYVFTVVFIGSFFWNNKKNLLYAIILYAPLLLFISVAYAHIHHMGYLYLLFLFCLWIFYDKDLFLNFKKNVRLWILLWLLLFHTGWSARCGWYDVFHSSSAGKEVAEYIKPYITNKKSIASVNFFGVAVQPYFKERVFVNWERDFWLFRDKAKNYEFFKSENMQDLPDILIMQPNFIEAESQYGFMERMANSDLYELDKVFFAKLATKQTIWTQSPIAVYIRKSIQQGEQK